MQHGNLIRKALPKRQDHRKTIFRNSNCGKISACILIILKEDVLIIDGPFDPDQKIPTVTVEI